MRRSVLARVASAPLLAALALCALVISTTFFLHIRHNPAGATAPRRSTLPGLTLGLSGTDLIVTSTQSGGEAARRGIRVGDDVVAIDGKAFHSLDQAEAYLVRAPRDEIMLELRQNGHERLVALDRTGE